VSNIYSIQKQLSEIKNGEHNIVVCPDSTMQRLLYSIYCRIRLEKKGELMFVHAHADSTALIKSYLEDAGVDVQYHESRGSLKVVNSLRKLFLSGADFLTFLDRMDEKIKKTGTLGVSLLVDAGSFHHFTTASTLLACETLINSLHDIKPLTLLCTFQKDDFDRLTEQGKSVLLKQHRRKIMVEQEQ
jgi:MEDS: MEthanogen/methylotroph, DcmR Sensory domain